MVVAAPGTGKTKTIVDRMIRLVHENPERNVAFVTFTRTSRRDTEKKLREAVGEKALDIAEGRLPRITTLHRFAKWLVHLYATASGQGADFTVLAPRQGEKNILVSEVIEDVGLDAPVADIERAITQYRCTGEWPPDDLLQPPTGARIVETFDALLKFYNTFDMEGLVLRASDLLGGRARELPPVFLQVDEYQDLNRRDQELVHLVCTVEGSEVVVVGDDAQSIYGMRHAHPGGIRELWASEEWENQPLPRSHRLPAHIVRAAHSLIRDRGYVGGEVELPDDDGRKIPTFRCTQRTTRNRPSIQIELVARYVNSVAGTAKKDDGSPVGFRDMMVLCPTNNHVQQAAAALDACYGIPTRRRESGAIPDDVWKLLLVLRMVGSGDSLALRQWLEIAGLSRSEVRRIRREAMEAGQSLYECCERLGHSGIRNVLRSLASVRQALADATEFRQALSAFPALPLTRDVGATIDEMVIECFPAVGRMIGYAYEKYGLIDAEEESDDVAEEDKVLVTTMHGAKGLEAEFVFITSLNRRFLPFAGRDRDEEERVLYVALTRAHQEVVLTFEEEWDPRAHRRLRDEAMSPFLLSIRDHLHIEPVTASTVSSICSA